MSRRWIQGAIKKPESLTKYVKRRWGHLGFDSEGRIRVAILRRLAKDPKVTKTTRARARLALTLRGFKRKVKRE